MDVHNIRMYGLNIKDLTLAKNPKGDKAKATNHNMARRKPRIRSSLYLLNWRILKWHKQIRPLRC